MTVVVSAISNYPVMLAETVVKNLSEGLTKLISLKKELVDKLLIVDKIIAAENAVVSLRIQADTWKEETRTVNLGVDFYLHAFSLFEITASATSSVTNYTLLCSQIWQKPTVAHKILFDKPLTDEEREVAEAMNVAESVEKGTLPLPFSTFIERITKTMRRCTVARSDSSVAEIPIFPLADEVIILRSVQIPTDATLKIRVDGNDICTLDGRACEGSDVELYVIAEDELRLTFTPSATTEWRFTYERAKLTDYMRMLLGRLTRAHDEELWMRVKAGIV